MLGRDSTTARQQALYLNLIGLPQVTVVPSYCICFMGSSTLCGKRESVPSFIWKHNLTQIQVYLLALGSFEQQQQKTLDADWLLQSFPGHGLGNYLSTRCIIGTLYEHFHKYLGSSCCKLMHLHTNNLAKDHGSYRARTRLEVFRWSRRGSTFGGFQAANVCDSCLTWKPSDEYITPQGRSLLEATARNTRLGRFSAL